MEFHCINGQIVHKDNAKVSITDLGLNRGYGIFDYFKIIDGRLIFWEDHLARLERSARLMNLELPYDGAALKAQIYQLTDLNKVSTCAVKIMLTGGDSLDGFTPTSPNVYVIMFPKVVYPKLLLENGLHLMTVEYVRDLSAVKSLNYAMGLIHMGEMKAMGAQELLYHKDGWISEAARANIFIVKEDDTLVTPDKDILEGVTRKKMIELATKYHKIEVRPVNLEEVFQAKEAFISGSTKGALPVTKVDGKVIGSGKPGTITAKMNELYNELTDNYIKNAALRVA